MAATIDTVMRNERISPKQIKMIHTLKSVLAMEDDSYRDMLGAYGVETSIDLSYLDAHDIISRLTRHAEATGKWRTPDKRHNDLAGRPDMASPKQLRLIAALWGAVSRAPVDMRDKALDAFLTNRFKIASIRWVRSRDVGKIVATLKNMALQQQKGVSDGQKVS